MKTIIQLWFYSILFIMVVHAEEACPACGGNVTSVGKITDDKSKPSKNLSVWNRSICGNLQFGDESLICTICWSAKYNDPPSRWERTSELPNSFVIPLSDAVLKFPVPKNSATYRQQFEGKDRIDSVFFSCDYSEDIIAGYKQYSESQKLDIVVERSKNIEGYPDIAFVVIKHKQIAQQAATRNR